MPPPTRVMMPCSGLESVQGGFETFTRECFEALRKDNSLEVLLIKGSGKTNATEIVARNIPRTRPLAQRLSLLLHISPYGVEQIAFSIGLALLIPRHRPQVIFLSDRAVGKILNKLRPLLRTNYKIVLCNGGGFEPPYPHFDYVQHVAPLHHEIALKAGERPENQTLIPYGFHIPTTFPPLSEEEASTLRKTLQLPLDRKIVLSVGQLEKTRKRMDYLIEEVAKMPEPRPYLVMLGHEIPATAEIRALAQARLGEANYVMKSVAPSQIGDYYRAADLFALASLNESFGRVYVEALSYGLPVIAHDNPITRFVTQDKAHLADLSQAGALSNLIAQTLSAFHSPEDAKECHRFAYENFSWDRLAPKYAAMLHQCAEGKPLP